MLGFRVGYGLKFRLFLKICFARTIYGGGGSGRSPQDSPKMCSE